jgi:hypothetical protein
MRRAGLVLWCGVATVVACDACASGGYVPTPSPPEPELLTVTITTSGVNPSLATVSERPAVVEFVNLSLDAVEIRSNPHPAHRDCAELNLVGEIEPGHRVAMLSPLDVGRNCGYHDERRLSDPRFAGEISVR